MNQLWYVWVGNGNFIVRAHGEEEAIMLARKEAEDYVPNPQDAQKADAGAELLDLEGEPEVLKTDYS